ncbi:MAG: sulfotransferase domain-containing protein [Bacteroidales bacterium]
MMENTNYNICIVSYPRSGNTFMRHIFKDVFGLFSWNSYDRYRFLSDVADSPWVRERDMFFINNRHYTPEELKELFPSRIIKTHELPDDSAPFPDQDTFIILIIRDGRDAVVSEAHHRSDIIEPGSPFSGNLLEAICAPGGSHFGGWSANLKAWIPRAHLIFHFEQLIAEPEKCIRKLMEHCPLPVPDFTRIPTFESQREGKHAYISNDRIGDFADDFSRLFFRRGEPGAWREEMPPEMQQLFLERHGTVLEELGYHKDNIESLKYHL